VKREQAASEKNGSIPSKIGKREIARAFGVRGADRIALKRILKELEAEGAIERRRKVLRPAGGLPEVVLADVQTRDRDGELTAVPVEWDEEEHGPAPKILIEARQARRAARDPAPGLGDRALLRVRPNHESSEGGPAYVGRVIKLVSRAKTRALGVFRADPAGGGRIVPVDKKALGREHWIPAGAEAGAQDGDLVSVDISSNGRFGRAGARVAERLGSVKNERAISLIAIRKHGIPDQFGAAAQAEADAAPKTPLTGREDWRRLPLVTIDPVDAKDHDDAVHAELDSDPGNRDGFILTVAIADVAAYVRPGSALDREALDRGNSVYFPDRVTPMLPERISTDLCSLRAAEDRPALAVRMTIDREGRKLRHSFHRIMIRSAARLTYQQAQAAVDGVADEITAPLLEPVLRPLWAAYDALKLARERRGPLDLDIPERKIVLNERGGVERVIVPARLEAHRLIEEFMILANVAAAETLEERRQPLIYRVHDEPTVEKISDLADFLASLGVKLAKGQVMRPAQFNAILARVAGTPHEILVNETVLRAQAQAEYAARNYGHFGLHLRRYAHFTSPIRRYADLIVHRALIRALDLGRDGLDAVELSELDEIAARISAAERRAVAAERETTDRLIATWLADRVGATFEGRVSGVTRVGLFVKLVETGADGFVPAATLGAEYFRHDERRRALVGDRTRQSFRIGDAVTVKLVEAAPFAGALRFEIVRAAGKAPPRDDRAALARDRKSSGGRDRSRSFDKEVDPRGR
jgi:ribonuclease R